MAWLTEDEVAARMEKAGKEVRRYMKLRCEREGHEYTHGVTASFRYVGVCIWCGEHDR